MVTTAERFDFDLETHPFAMVAHTITWSAYQVLLWRAPSGCVFRRRSTVISPIVTKRLWNTIAEVRTHARLVTRQFHLDSSISAGISVKPGVAAQEF